MNLTENIRHEMDIGSQVTANPTADIGSKNLHNQYHVEHFSPMSLVEAQALLGGLFFQNMSQILEIGVDRNGQLMIPRGMLCQTIALPSSMIDEMFAYPDWVEDFANLVVDEGLNDSLDKHLKGSAYTAAWYVGITTASDTFAAGDTMASHAGWTENTAYSNATRPTLTLGAVSGKSVDNSASKAQFNINATTTVGGAFVVSNSTKGGSTGILYGGGAFTADRSLANGDTLNVTITCTAS